jgi:hypothetical protein
MHNETLKKLFNFLQNNRVYNKNVQNAFYKDVVLYRSTANDKIVSLLYHVANTQSQPNIDKLAEFFQRIYLNYSRLSTFEEFVSILIGKQTIGQLRYFDLFCALKHQSGWGNKTAALFVKSVYHLHNGEYGEELKIWDDAPTKIFKDEQFYLPVDAVIEFIFKRLELPITVDFNGINNYLFKSKLYNAELMEIWDDLWFWGFITQKGGGDKRFMEWNENKYWALLHTDKDQKTINEISNKAVKFIGILT